MEEPQTQLKIKEKFDNARALKRRSLRLLAILSKEDSIIWDTMGYIQNVGHQHA